MQSLQDPCEPAAGWHPPALGRRLGILYSLVARRAIAKAQSLLTVRGSPDDLRRIMASYRSSWPARRDQLWEMFLKTLASSALWADFIKRRHSAA
jgi:hypothetical protein